MKRNRILSGILLVVFGLGQFSAAQDGLADQPAPRAVPVDELRPDFSGMDEVVSHSGQFRISGSDSRTRGTAANLAEDTKTDFLKLMEEKDEWKVPVSISLSGKRGDEVPMRLTGFRLRKKELGYEVGVFVNLSKGLPAEAFKRAVSEALVYAKGLEGKPWEEGMKLRVPPWVAEGFLEAIAWGRGESDRKLYEVLFRSGGFFELNDLLEFSRKGYEEADAVTRAAFRVSSGALMMALLEQPGGKAGIQEFAENLAGFQGEIPSLLREHFPELNLSATSLAKWWKLQLAAKGAALLTESLGVKETEERLEKLLRVQYRDAEGLLLEVPFSQWQTVRELEGADRIDSVKLAQDDLLRLSYRCFPSYRSLLQEYQLLLTNFVKGETKGLSDSLLALEETREIMVGKAEKARDFLDWFEITRARETSGAFDDYLTLKARLKTRPRRKTDEMSRYLDRLDPLFKMPKQRQGYSPMGMGAEMNMEMDVGMGGSPF